VPELPEVEALALDLKGPAGRPRHRPDRPRGVQRPQDVRPAAAGTRGHVRRRRHAARQVPRHQAGGLHLCLHLARAGWVRWKDEVPAAPPARAASRRSPHASSSTTTPASTSPRPAPRRAWPCTSCGHRSTYPVSRRWVRTRWWMSSRRRCSRASSRPRAASSSRACCATRARSPASATPTPTRSCTPRGCRRSSRPNSLDRGRAGHALRRRPRHPRRCGRPLTRAGRQ
jgi:hypothetical protein